MPALGSTARLLPMRPRDPHESGRTASTLELFFDLVFVVAVSIAAVQLAHELEAGHVADGLIAYGIVFFAIWWAWMNFTWFATSFDTDDWLYRVLTIVQMTGVLVLAAGIAPLFERRDFTILVIAYVVMRVAMVAQWLRASRAPGPTRRVALIYAGGISVVQVLWLGMLVLPAQAQLPVALVLVLAEISIPVIAETRGEQTTPWHPHHITERYGLFTLILLGESLLASSNAIIHALQDDHALGELIALAVLTVVVTAGLWWIYFWPPHHDTIGSLAQSLRYGYVHYFVFAAAGAFSAGIELEVAQITGGSHLSEVATSFTVTVPIAVFILGIWWIVIRACADRTVNVAVPTGAVLVLLDPVLPIPVTLTAAIVVVIVVVLVLRPPAGKPVASGR